MALPFTGDDLYPRLAEIPDQRQGHAVVDVGDNSDHRSPSRGAVPLSMPKIARRSAAGWAYFQLLSLPQNIRKDKGGDGVLRQRTAKKGDPSRDGPR